jgi:hypothetical protein
MKSGIYEAEFFEAEKEAVGIESKERIWTSF